MKPMTDVLELIISDMEKDVRRFERKPFNGRTLGELHGELCATVQALAKIQLEFLRLDSQRWLEHVPKPNGKAKDVTILP
jgi:hypothetical protein